MLEKGGMWFVASSEPRRKIPPGRKSLTCAIGSRQPVLTWKKYIDPCRRRKSKFTWHAALPKETPEAVAHALLRRVGHRLEFVPLLLMHTTLIADYGLRNLNFDQSSSAPHTPNHLLE